VTGHIPTSYFALTVERALLSIQSTRSQDFLSRRPTLWLVISVCWRAQ